jgi:hypothetical protein
MKYEYAWLVIKLNQGCANLKDFTVMKIHVMVFWIESCEVM